MGRRYCDGVFRRRGDALLSCGDGVARVSDTCAKTSDFVFRHGGDCGNGCCMAHFRELDTVRRRLRLGRDGERCVGQFLERLRDGGGQVFHDIPGECFNLDHVVISSHGIYARLKPRRLVSRSQATVMVEGDSLRIAGRIPDRNPIEQATAAAQWLERLLEKSTGKQFSVRGVVVFPGWYVEQRSPRGTVWVLEPKALPAFIEQEPALITPANVALAAFHLSRYVRTEVEKVA